MIHYIVFLVQLLKSQRVCHSKPEEKPKSELFLPPLMALIPWPSACRPSSLGCRLCSSLSWNVWLSELSLPLGRQHCCSSSSCSSSSHHLSLPVCGWGRATCLIAVSGDGSLLFPTFRSIASFPRSESRSMSMRRSEASGLGSARTAALAMWMSPAWSEETVAPSLGAEEAEVAPYRAPAPF